MFNTIKVKKLDMFVAETTSQHKYLAQMGAVSRLERLIGHSNVSEKQAESLISSFMKIFKEDEMGNRFKVFAFSKNQLNIPGFERIY
jgi:SAM-dependent MidA family methyltransferase